MEQNKLVNHTALNYAEGIADLYTLSKPFHINSNRNNIIKMISALGFVLIGILNHFFSQGKTTIPIYYAKILQFTRSFS